MRIHGIYYGIYYYMLFKCASTSLARTLMTNLCGLVKSAAMATATAAAVAGAEPTATSAGGLHHHHQRTHTPRLRCHTTLCVLVRLCRWVGGQRGRQYRLYACVRMRNGLFGACALMCFHCFDPFCYVFVVLSVAYSVFSYRILITHACA